MGGFFRRLSDIFDVESSATDVRVGAIPSRRTKEDLALAPCARQSAVRSAVGRFQPPGMPFDVGAVVVPGVTPSAVEREADPAQLALVGVNENTRVSSYPVSTVSCLLLPPPPLCSVR